MYLQEVKFNAALCRCAIAAAQAHEADTFASCANSTKYHAAMMRKHPALKFVPHDRLPALCTRYGQPCPELPVAGAGGQPAVASGAAAAAEPSHTPRQATASSGNPAVLLSDSADAAVQEKETGLGDSDAVGGPGTSHRACSGPQADGSAEDDAGGEGEVDDLFKELFGDDGDEGAAATTSGPRCEKQPAVSGADGDEHTNDIGTEAQVVEGTAVVGDGSMPGPVEGDEEQIRAPEQSDEHPVKPAEPHPDDDFQQFVRERKRAKRQHSVDRGQSGGVEAAFGAAGTPLGGEVRLEVQKYVGELLEPWLKGGRIDVRQYTDILGRVVEKVIGAHADAGDAGFLEQHAASIRKLVDRYVKFTMKR